VVATTGTNDAEMNDIGGPTVAINAPAYGANAASVVAQAIGAR
jgi:hypothetical protein